MNLCQAGPLPFEILEVIIDETAKFPENSGCYHSLYLWTLVSRSFRNRAHHHIFRTIEFNGLSRSVPSNIFSRLWKFYAIIEAGLHFPMTTPLFHVRSLKLVMDCSIFESYAILENPSLAAILRILREHSGFIDSVSIQGSAFPILWSELTSKFRSSFTDLCKAPSLTTFHLEGMIGIPHTILEGTNIKHIHFHLVEFASSTVGILPVLEDFLPPGQLESLSIDHTFPFPAPMERESGTRGVSHSNPTFSNIKEFKYLLNHSSDLQIFVDIAMGLAPSLVTICLEFSELDVRFLGVGAWEIPFHQLPLLRNLAIQFKVVVTPAILPLLNLVLAIRSILTPSSLSTLELAFDVRSNSPWLKKSDFYPDPDLWVLLDSLLQLARFDSVNTVLLRLRYHILCARPWTFDERVFLDNCRGFAPEVFPRLTSSKSKALDLILTVAPVAQDPEGYDASD